MKPPLVLQWPRPLRRALHDNVHLVARRKCRPDRDRPLSSNCGRVQKETQRRADPLGPNAKVSLGPGWSSSIPAQ